MNNDKGFIMPLVVILSFLFLAVIVHQIAQLESDRQFLLQRQNDFRHHTLLQMASVDLLPILEKIDTIEDKNGQLRYDIGTVNYEIRENNQLEVTVKLTSTTDQTGKREASLVYDKTKQSISSWTE